MFPEFREKITELKTTDHHFMRLFEQHNALDHQVESMEAGITPARHEEIEKLKKEKLLLKDQLFAILTKA
jgi:uncharacterized protein YdcH (DUF465 family)